MIGGHSSSIESVLGQAGHSFGCEFTGLGELVWVQKMYRDRLLEVF